MQAAVAHSPSTQVQKLSETDEHLNEDGRQSSHESDKESTAGRHSHTSSDIAPNNTQPESPASEGLTLIHPHQMTIHAYFCICSFYHY